MQFPKLTDIQRRRKLLGLTQSQLAKQVNVSQSLLTKVERGLVVPNYEIAMNIFSVLESMESKDQVIAKDAMHAHVITLKPSDTIQKAVALVKKHTISQFPVVEGHRLVGSIASLDLVGESRNARIGDILREPFSTVNETTPISVVKSILKSSRAVVVLNKGEIRGIITAEDLL